MRVRVKVCGITTEEAVDAAVRHGVDAVGFVFAASPRRVSVSRARELARALPPFVTRVAVLHHPRPDELARVLDGFDPDVVQVELSDGLLPRLVRCRSLLPVLHDDGSLDEQLALARASGSRAVHLEAAGCGGRGIAPDWRRAAVLARELRLVLAGGLAAANVAAAIRAVAPFAVDVSSGIECAPGVKDPRAVAAFVAAVRAAERELEHEVSR